MKIYYSSRFTSAYKRLPRNVKLQAEKKEKIFRKDPFDKSLKTHKLTGRLKSLWAFSINYQYRIIFEFVKEDVVWFHTIGTHEIYNK